MIAAHSPVRWPKLNPHYLQCRLWNCKKRYVEVAAGRGSGKTEIARRFIVRQLPMRVNIDGTPKTWDNPLYFYALPTFKMAKRIAWVELKRLIPKDWLAKSPNESELMIETIFGSTLYVLGMDKPSRAEGVQWDFGIVDEACDQKPNLVDMTLGPALTHRHGGLWEIGVPKRFGVGAHAFKKRFDLGLNPDNPDYASFSWESQTVLSQEQLREKRENMDPRDFNEQFCATWESATGACFYAFDQVHNVDRTGKVAFYKPDRKLFIGTDFNVDPLCWIYGQYTDDKKGFNVIDEISLRGSNTKQALDVTFKRYGTHESGIVFFGDATSRNRHTSAATTDYIQIFNDKRFKQCEVNFPFSNPPVLDRIAACNAMFLNAEGKRRCTIHWKCKRLIEDCNGLAYKVGTREPDDSDKKMGHASDAFGYVMIRLFPLRAIANTAPGVFY